MYILYIIVCKLESGHRILGNILCFYFYLNLNPDKTSEFNILENIAMVLGITITILIRTGIA